METNSPELLLHYLGRPLACRRNGVLRWWVSIGHIGAWRSTIRVGSIRGRLAIALGRVLNGRRVSRITRLLRRIPRAILVGSGVISTRGWDGVGSRVVRRGIRCRRQVRRSGGHRALWGWRGRVVFFDCNIFTAEVSFRTTGAGTSRRLLRCNALRSS